MQLTMTGEYAIRAMVFLSSLPSGTTAQISEISREWDIPENFLRKIVAQLAKSGLISSQRGMRGGVALARPAGQLTLIDVIEAVEGPMRLNKCVMSTQSCSRSSWCPVHVVWCDAQEKLRASLMAQSLAGLAAEAVRHHASAKAARPFQIPDRDSTHYF
jgi:Rrf2 family protein